MVAAAVLYSSERTSTSVRVVLSGSSPAAVAAASSPSMLPPAPKDVSEEPWARAASISALAADGSAPLEVSMLHEVSSRVRDGVLDTKVARAEAPSAPMLLSRTERVCTPAPCFAESAASSRRSPASRKPQASK